ncbi:hypothetical protein Poly41_55510 [Novipirellula artificiosorum]|uniref:Uncharacterized protein n=1 Tax=Novipirellula artificiosorum TaxID=2528016 RepID=A0A5C6D5Y0_9BACT|nr:hypothetical protein Poly41_55510 [Novipirellula artificiosorum]
MTHNDARCERSHVRQNVVHRLATVASPDDTLEW